MQCITAEYEVVAAGWTRDCTTDGPDPDSIANASGSWNCVDEQRLSQYLTAVASIRLEVRSVGKLRVQEVGVVPAGRR